MAAKPFLECSFLIPIRGDRNLSDGKLHGRRPWYWLENQLMKFGGATQAKGLYQGCYLDPQSKQHVRDMSRKYFVALPRMEIGRLRSLLRQACVVFQQKCIYLSVAGYVQFVKGPRRETN